MKHRVRRKNCKLCGQASEVLYRVKYQPANPWWFVCPPCWTSLKQEGNSYYIYGGTWKAKKRH